jgi:hypothetical protein
MMTVAAVLVSFYVVVEGLVAFHLFRNRHFYGPMFRESIRRLLEVDTIRDELRLQNAQLRKLRIAALKLRKTLETDRSLKKST